MKEKLVAPISNSPATVIDPAKVDAIINSRKMSDIVIWTGSGVDHGNPRNLPLSSEIVEFLLRFVMPECGAPFLARWKSCKNEFEADIGFVPRMETLLGAIKTCENQLAGEYSVMEGLRFFDDAPANTNSTILANALLQGADVVTTNYSQIIEAEAMRLSPEYRYKLVADETFPTYCVSTPKNAEHGSVYHIHGVSADPQSMGITLPLISRRFAESFERKLADRFLSPQSVFVFAGYSGSDIYDVNRFFEEFSSSKSGAKKQAVGIFLRHSQRSNHPSPKEQALLGPFRTKLICTAELENFFTVPLEDSTSGNLRTDVSFDWEQSFRQHAIWPSDQNTQKDYESLFALALSDYFGLSVSDLLPLDFEKLKRIKGHLSPSGQWYADYYSLRYAGMSGNETLLRQLSPLFANDYVLSRILSKELGQVDDIQPLYAAPEEIAEALQRHLRNKEVIDWPDVSSPINHWSFEFLRELSCCVNRDEMQKTIHDNAGAIASVLKSADIVKRLPYDAVVELRQVATAARSAAILRALLFKTDNADTLDADTVKGDIRFARRLYDDISSINGLSITVLAEAIIHIFIEGDKNEASRKLQCAERVARASSDTYSLRKCAVARQLLNGWSQQPSDEA